MNAARTGWPVRLTVVASVLVLVGALLAAWWQRPDAPVAGQREQAEPSATADELHCGNSECDVIATAKANGSSVELLAGTNRRVGKIRVVTSDGDQVLGVSISRLGVPLGGNSLRCASGRTPACLVTGPHANGVVGQVFLARDGSWESPARPFFSNAGGIVLDNVLGDDSPEVVVVEHSCGPDTELAACRKVPVVAKVYGLGGKVRGCTESYPWPARIPGWPDVDLDGKGLRSCP